MTQVELCNLALRKIGSSPIVAFTDQTTAAQVCSQIYGQIVTSVLAMHNWPSCMKRVALSSVTVDANLYQDGYSAYQLPADNLRVLEVYGDSATPTPDWYIEGSVIFGLVNVMSVKYVYSPADPTIMEVSLQNVIILALAAQLAIAIVGNEQLSLAINEELKIQLVIAQNQTGIKVQHHDTREVRWTEFTGNAGAFSGLYDWPYGHR